MSSPLIIGLKLCRAASQASHGVAACHVGAGRHPLVRREMLPMVTHEQRVAMHKTRNTQRGRRLGLAATLERAIRECWDGIGVVRMCACACCVGLGGVWPSVAAVDRIVRHRDGATVA